MTKYIAYKGAEWVKRTEPEKQISKFGETIADIWGAIFQGAYHSPSDILRADLSHKNYVIMTVDAMGDWATYDNERLMVMIVLCYKKKIRLQINACSPQCIKITFSQRYHSTMDIFDGIPTIEEHIARIKKYYIVKEKAQNE